MAAQNTKRILPLPALLPFIPLFVTLASGIPTEKVFFASSFEGDATLVKEASEHGDRIVLYETGDLHEWVGQNGQGWITIPGDPEPLCFKYTRRTGNVLEGVSGLHRKCPEYSEVQTCGFFGWGDVPQACASLVQGIHGPGATEIAFHKTDRYCHLFASILPRTELFGRFYVRLSPTAIRSLSKDHDLAWFYEHMSDIRGHFRIGCAFRNNMPVFCARFHVYTGTDNQKHDVYIYGKEPVLPGRDYCVEFYYHCESDSNGGARFWIDGALAGDSTRYCLRNIGGVQRMHFGTFSWAKFDTGHIVIDDIIFGGERIGPVPRIDSLSFPDNVIFLSTRDEYVNMQVQATDSGASWFLSGFNSGTMKKGDPLPEHALENATFMRVRIQNAFGAWSEWLTRALPKVSGSSLMDRPSSPIRSMSLAGIEGHNSLNTLFLQKWAVLNMRFSRMPFRVDALLSHFTDRSASLPERIGVGRERSNYFFRILLNDGLLWTHSFEGDDVLCEISGQKHNYVKEHGVAIDTAAKSVSLSFRLSDSAKAGPWLLQAIAYDSVGGFGMAPVLFPFNVVEKEREAEGLPLGLIMGVIAIIGGLAGVIIFRKRAPRKKADLFTYSGNPTIRRAQEIINEEIGNPALDVESVATKLRISKSNISSQFKKETGYSFPQYLNLLRIEKARELLKTSNMNISEIAFNIGYGTYEHFNYIFNQHEKMSASEFRRKFGIEEQNR